MTVQPSNLINQLIKLLGISISKSIKESELTKRKILVAAKNEFAEKGFNGARMSSIATKAGVNQALLHYHFESKENLYQNIFHMGLGEDIKGITNKIRDELKSWEAPAEKELAAMLYLITAGHIATHDEELNRIMAREIADGQRYFHDFARLYMFPRISLMEEFIKNGIRSGTFEISNPLLFAISIISFVADYVHGEAVIKGTDWYNQLYRDKKKTLYNHVLETSLKALSPRGKEIPIPVLSKKEIAVLDAFIDEISGLFKI